MDTLGVGNRCSIVNYIRAIEYIHRRAPCFPHYWLIMIFPCFGSRALAMTRKRAYTQFRFASMLLVKKCPYLRRSVALCLKTAHKLCLPFRFMREISRGSRNYCRPNGISFLMLILPHSFRLFSRCRNLILLNSS